MRYCYLGSSFEQSLQILDSKAADDPSVDLAHLFLVELADIIFKAGFVYRPDLTEKHGRRQRQAGGIDRYIVWQIGLISVACDRCHDGDGTVLIGDIVLQNKYGTAAALFAPDNGI